MSILGRLTARTVTALVLAVGAVCAVGARAGASSITVPSGPPLVVANAPLEVVATGFRPGQNVFVEQCDGVSPTLQSWNVTLDCDLGSSPPAAIADAHGTATFPADDVNRAFHPFEGESPQSLFNCMSAGKRAPSNQLPTFTNCKLRVSSNNSSTTGDQVFLPITLTGRSVPVPKRAGRVPASTTSVPLTHGPTSPNATAARKAAAPAAGVKGSDDRDRTAAVGEPAAPLSAAPSVSAPSNAGSGAGLMALSDPGVRTGYLLLLLGLLIAFVPVLAPRRRRVRAPTPEQPVTRTEPAGEGT